MSVGVVAGEPVVDLDYLEDKDASVCCAKLADRFESGPDDLAITE